MSKRITVGSSLVCAWNHRSHLPISSSACRSASLSAASSPKKHLCRQPWRSYLSKSLKLPPSLDLKTVYTIFLGRHVWGSLSDGSTMKCRISTSKSTHSCTKQRSTLLPGCSTSCASASDSTCELVQARTSIASQLQPSFATPFCTGAAGCPVIAARPSLRFARALMAFAAALPGLQMMADRGTAVVSGTCRGRCRHICVVHSFDAKILYRWALCGKRVGIPAASIWTMSSSCLTRST
mmetsp:Transcript_48282/g.125204  ORF Transcript_48282/g.125204 Transcript_48282/m.125204 type:complete len:238 (+) Transcript_48282:469-1182(+)